MLLRRFGPLSLAILAAACAPPVDKVPGPSQVDYAVFDVTSAVPAIPQPNDLVLLGDISALPVPEAQKDLLRDFQSLGDPANRGFPNDQEVAISIDFQTVQVGEGGLQTRLAPDLDLSSIVPGKTLAIFAIAGGVAGGVTLADLDPITAANYSKGANSGTLTIHNKGRQRWKAGAQYMVGVRGGPNGVKLTNGNPIQPSSTTFLLIADKDLSLPENQTLIQLQLGSRSAAAAAGIKLEGLRQGYLGAFKAIDSVFPHSELALVQTFKIKPLTTPHVETDPNAGLIPLPSDFLLDPGNGGKTVVFNSAFGPAARGLATLDGFSTTAMAIAQISGFINARTITKDTVFLYELTATGPVLVDPATYETEPSAITATPANTPCAATGPCLTNVIGLQPGAPALSNLLTSKPLKEKTTYGVVISTKVKDLNGGGLSRSTLGKILLFQNPIVTGTTSNLIGVDNATAGALEGMRRAVDALVIKATADGKVAGRDEVAMAYTFRTQSITGTALALAAAPYAKLNPLGGNFPLSAGTTENPLQAFARFGVDPSMVPTNQIDFIMEVPIVTLNLLDPANGAFRADQSVCTGGVGVNPCLEVIKALVAVPKLANVTTACPTPLDSTLACAPLVVFRHGIGEGRGKMLDVANRMAGAGFVTVAIDSAKHGERSFCARNADCKTGFECISDPALAGQADAKAPGYCQTAGSTASAANFGKNLAYAPVTCPSFPATPGACNNYDPTAGGIPSASGNFLISANFFRTRDTFRQDILDQSQLVNVMTSASSATVPHAVFATLKAHGLRVDPRFVYAAGQATVDSAVNPRISKVALNVAGGTIVDAFTNAPEFAPIVDALLASIGINKVADPAGYLKFLIVAKWILDPAEPLNFARHLKLKPLPDLLADQTGATPMAPKKVLGQRAQCDANVPDVFQILLYNNVGLSPLSLSSSQVTVFTSDPSGVANNPFVCPAGAVSHRFLTNWSSPTAGSPTLTTQAQNDIANFFQTDALPAPVRVP